MKLHTIGGAIAGAMVCAGAAGAVPGVVIRGAAAKVVVIPEARSDILVTVIQANPRFPIRVTRFGKDVFIDGDVAHLVGGCPSSGPHPGVRINGRGVIPLDQLPSLAVRTPLAVKIAVGEGVYGAIGRADSLDFASRGCGDWVIANVRRRLRISEVGSGAARAGSAGTGDLSVAGSGSIETRAIHAGLTALSSGDGDITAASGGGPLMIRVAGSGNIQVLSGEASQMNVSIAGSGAVRFGGLAHALIASVAGPGYISVSQVKGPIKKQVFGAGEIQAGR